MDRLSEKQLADLRAMRQASKLHSHRIAVAEAISNAHLIKSSKLLYHRRPGLIKRILGGK